MVERYRPAPTTPALGEGFYDVVRPATFPKHVLRFRNDRVAKPLGLAFSDEGWIDHFARFQPLPDNLREPLALRYHGHQFQQYNPRLGDGRGFLYAQLRDDRGRLLDLSTKGSGQTPWSRGGDGRLTLKGGVREVLATEMLDALGVHTSQSVSLVETGEALQRSDEPSPTRASVLVRLCWSSIRFGTFQRLAHEEDTPRIKKLVDYTIEHYFPTLSTVEQLFAAIVDRAASLVADWTVAGFVHGVLNSDNMNVTGESFDYGPWRFLPIYDPLFTAAYFDHSGLYAFARQGNAVRWNLERLAEALSPIAGTLERSLADYEVRVLRATTEKFLWRLNVASTSPPDDALLVQRILCFMRASKVGWDRFFFDCEGGESGRAPYDGEHFAAVRRAWEGRAPRMKRSPLAAPVTMIIDEVERIWSAIDERDDWAPFHEKIADVRRLAQHLAGE